MGRIDSQRAGQVVIDTPEGPALLVSNIEAIGDRPFYPFKPTIFGEMQVANNYPFAAWRADYNVNTRIVTPTQDNSATVTASESKFVLQSGTDPAGNASIRSTRALRYLPGVGGLVRFTAVFGTPATDNVQIIGLGDAQDGFFFGYNGLDFGVLRRRAGVDSWTLQTAWNGQAIGFNPLLGNVYEINYQWLGFGYIVFSIEQPQVYADGFLTGGLFRDVHSIQYPNVSTDASILNPTLPLFAQCINDGNTTNVTLQSSSAVAFLQGGIAPEINPLDIANSADVIASIASANNEHLLTIHNKATFQSVANRVPVEITSIIITRSGSAVTSSACRLYLNATTAIPLVYADVDTNNSPVEESATTTTVTGGQLLRTFSLSDSSTVLQINFRVGELILNPGQSLTIAIQNSGIPATTAVANINWFEQF